MLKSYFYVIGISYDKTYFICIWIDLSEFKMIISSGLFIYLFLFIEDMQITQETI